MVRVHYYPPKIKAVSEDLLQVGRGSFFAHEGVDDYLMGDLHF